MFACVTVPTRALQFLECISRVSLVLFDGNPLVTPRCRVKALMQVAVASTSSVGVDGR